MAKKDNRIYRALDANANRLREALRVLEDLSRFVLSSRTLAAAYKSLRHDVTKQLLRLPASYRDLVAARDSKGDVGRNSFILDKKKTAIADIALRNVKRAEEASRVLEEFLKLIQPKLAFEFQKIRFQIYDLEKKTIPKL